MTAQEAIKLVLAQNPGVAVSSVEPKRFSIAGNDTLFFHVKPVKGDGWFVQENGDVFTTSQFWKRIRLNDRHAW